MPCHYKTIRMVCISLLLFAVHMQAIYAQGGTNTATWTGNNGTSDVTDAGNWQQGILPSATTNVIIAFTSNPQPIATGTFSVLDLTVQAGATLTISNAVLRIGGAINNAGLINGASATIEMNGTTAQAIPANSFAANTIRSLVVNNTAGVSLAGPLSITGSLISTAGTLHTGGYLTLRSTSISNTAIVAPVQGAIDGDVTVERFIPLGKRAYRHLASGVNTSTAIRSNWQNNGVYTPGVGIYITGNAAAANGFDATQTGSASMFTYTPGAASFTAVANTDVDTLHALKGYRTFIMGDRNADLSVPNNTGPGTDNIAMNAATTLHATGRLITGDVTFSKTGTTTYGNSDATVTLGASNNDFSFIANPYWSPVNFDALTKTDINPTYWMWDPNIGHRGAYTSYTSGSGSSGGGAITRDIQPGQSIFVQTAANTTNTPEHTVMVVLENRAYEQIVGNADAPFINALIANPHTKTLVNSYALTRPSQPNYLQLFSGSDQGVNHNNVPANIPFTTPNIGAALIASGQSFIGYAESMPSVGYTGEYGNGTLYARKHNPWVNWQGAPTNGLPASVNRTWSDFPSDYNLLPTFAMITPNQMNDMHDGSVRQGDDWLRDSLGPYINWCLTHNSIFILTFDEDSNNGLNNNHVLTTMTGMQVNGGSSNQHVTHYNVLRTLEDMYQLPYAGFSADSSAIENLWLNTGGATLNPTLTFKEADKTTTLTNTFRQDSLQPSRMVVQLMSNVPGNGTSKPVDAATVAFKENFSGIVGKEDAEKFNNPDENLSILRGEKLLGLEGRHTRFANDTIPLRLTNLFTNNTYALQLDGSNFDASVNAFLHDKYYNQLYQLNTMGSTTVPFAFSSDSATYYNRFQLIFTATVALPVQVTSINANKLRDGVLVDWNVANENGIRSYEVERSGDGRTFTKMANVPASRAAGFSRYDWFDAHPLSAINYYRVRSVGTSGDIHYTGIAKVVFTNTGKVISVYPNPTKTNSVTISIKQGMAGVYRVTLTNKPGQVVSSTTLQFASATASQIIHFNVPKGTYQLQVKGKFDDHTEQLIVQ